MKARYRMACCKMIPTIERMAPLRDGTGEAMMVRCPNEDCEVGEWRTEEDDGYTVLGEGLVDTGRGYVPGDDPPDCHGLAVGDRVTPEDEDVEGEIIFLDEDRGVATVRWDETDNYAACDRDVSVDVLIPVGAWVQKP